MSAKPTDLGQIARFAAVGLANTALGLGVIMAMIAAGAGDFVANLCGYAAGLALSFALNRGWTFGRSGRASWPEAGAFLLAVTLSYLANAVVLGAMRGLGFRESLIGQGAAMLAYSVCFFLLSRHLVFRAKSDPCTAG